MDQAATAVRNQKSCAFIPEAEYIVRFQCEDLKKTVKQLGHQLIQIQGVRGVWAPTDSAGAETFEVRSLRWTQVSDHR